MRTSGEIITVEPGLPEALISGPATRFTPSATVTVPDAVTAATPSAATVAENEPFVPGVVPATAFTSRNSG